MKNIFSSILDTTKKKVGVTFLCAGVIATLGAGTALASSSTNSLLCKAQNGVASFSTDKGITWSPNPPEGVTFSNQDGKLSLMQGIQPKDGKSLLSKVENGVRSYSTDGGKTWSEKVPEGVTVDQDGNISFGSLKPTDGKGLMVRVENGVRSYSTDGGKTWSQNPPEGVTVSDQDGKVLITKGMQLKDGKGLPSLDATSSTGTL